MQDNYQVLRASDDHPTNTEKRLWWSILVRRTSLSLGLRHDTLIQPSKFYSSFGLPCESDFEDEISHSRTYSPKDKKRFIHMLRAHLKLSLILTDLFILSSSGQSAQSECPAGPGTDSPKPQIVLSVMSKLCDWLADAKDGVLLLEDTVDDPFLQSTSSYRSLILLQF
jgi:hypothetical protein